MDHAETKRFNALYSKHVKALTRAGYSPSSIDAYSRPLRRITAFYDKSPDCLTKVDIEVYFDSLVQSHSWSTAKVDRNGLQFFYEHILHKAWDWVDIIKPPRKKKSLLCSVRMRLLV